MATTSPSFLDRLRRAEPQSPEWQRLHEIYQPMIRAWLSRIANLGDETDDLVQDVLLVVVRELPAFERGREGSFRAWLRQIVVNRTRAFWKRRRRQPMTGLPTEDGGMLAQLEDPESDLSRAWDLDHDRHVWQKLQQIVRADFEPATWEAFRRFGIEGKPARAVAKELGLSENAVLLAKSRVLRRLREEAREILE